MAQHNRLIDLRLPEPRSFLPGGKDFDGDIFSSPSSLVDFPVAAFTDALNQRDLSGDGALNEQR